MDQIRHKTDQTQKLSQLGEFATGLAHELNQPLQLILGFARELHQNETLSPSGRALMEEIQVASLHMAEVIRKIRDYTRPSTPKTCEIQVKPLVEGMATLWKHALMEKGIDLTVKIEETLPTVKGDSTELNQVLINLISNAKDAIEDACVRRGKIQINVTHSHSQVVIQVQDNGIGMNESTCRKIFQHRFTTKDPKRGSGLGLHLCRKILKKMDASISVRSCSGSGSEFMIRIPEFKNERRKGETHESNKTLHRRDR